LFTTITDNSAQEGGGVFVYGSFTGLGNYYCRAGSLNLKNSILSGNEAPHGREAYVQRDSFRCLGNLGLVESLVGHDGEAGTVNAFLYDTIIVETPLTTLISPEWIEGAGQFPHHPLPWGSPAVDALPNEACEVEQVDASDQLLNARNVDGDYKPSAQECDVGAVERQPLPYHSFAPFAIGEVGQ
jgi:hypothetical protein